MVSNFEDVCFSWEISASSSVCKKEGQSRRFNRKHGCSKSAVGRVVSTLRTCWLLPRTTPRTPRLGNHFDHEALRNRMLAPMDSLLARTAPAHPFLPPGDIAALYAGISRTVQASGIPAQCSPFPEDLRGVLTAAQGRRERCLPTDSGPGRSPLSEQQRAIAPQHPHADGGCAAEPSSVNDDGGNLERPPDTEHDRAIAPGPVAWTRACCMDKISDGVWKPSQA